MRTNAVPARAYCSRKSGEGKIGGERSSSAFSSRPYRQQPPKTAARIFQRRFERLRRALGKDRCELYTKRSSPPQWYVSLRLQLRRIGEDRELRRQYGRNGSGLRQIFRNFGVFAFTLFNNRRQQHQTLPSAVTVRYRPSG